MTLSPDEHAAEAEKLLDAANDDLLDPAETQALAQMAIAHYLGALLASRPAETQREHFDGPDRIDLVRELREAVGLPAWPASSMPPRQAWLEAIEHARQPAKSRQGAVTLVAHEVVRQLVDDLRWLVGHLAHNAPDTVMLPPRLAPLVKECMDSYDPSRFTLAEPVPSTGEDQREPRHDGLKTCAATNEQLMAVCGLAPGHPGQHFDRSNHRGWSDFTLRPKPVPEEGSGISGAIPCECGHYQPDHYRGTGDCEPAVGKCPCVEYVPDEGSETNG